MAHALASLCNDPKITQRHTRKHPRTLHNCARTHACAHNLSLERVAEAIGVCEFAFGAVKNIALGFLLAVLLTTFLQRFEPLFVWLIILVHERNGALRNPHVHVRIFFLLNPHVPLQVKVFVWRTLRVHVRFKVVI